MAGAGVWMAERLDDKRCGEFLESLPGWEIVDGQLMKRFSFESYLEGLEFTTKCGRIAEEMNHHPDLLVQWRKVTLSILTHSSKGLTALDFEYASKVEKVARDVLMITD
ncbi:4a-hydroxytetrahydrobiopterin dehydratase [bacterium]|nr:4a-hydroxytetrahydrobiopterin dehydratase [bacterium]